MRGFINGFYRDGEIYGANFLAGMTGMGKTTEMLRLIAQCEGGVIFADPTARHGGLMRGEIAVGQPGELKDAMLANQGKRYRVRYVIPEEQPEEHFRALCRIVAIFGHTILAIDEVDMFCSSKWGEERMPPELYKLVHYGRHVRVSTLSTARDPASLSIRFRSQCMTMRIFRTAEEAYVRYFQARIGRENARRLPTLPQYHYMLSSSGEAGVSICKGGKLVTA